MSIICFLMVICFPFSELLLGDFEILNSTVYLFNIFRAGMLMDLLSPLFPSAFILIVCLGSISRSFSKFSIISHLKNNSIYKSPFFAELFLFSELPKYLFYIVPCFSWSC